MNAVDKGRVITEVAIASLTALVVGAINLAIGEVGQALAARRAGAASPPASSPASPDDR